MGARIHYVVAAYLGDRKFMDERFANDRWFYLRQQVAMLARLKHDLAAITFVINTDAPVQVPDDVAASGAAVVQRPNQGMSYGAWAHTFAQHGEAFSHYIFNEDDYLFTQQHFDALLCEEMQKRHRCAMLCGAAYEMGIVPVHPAVSCMMATSEGLCVIAKANGGELPHVHHDASRGDSPYPGGYHAQLHFGHALLAAGYGLEDWLLRWSTAFRMDGHPELATRWFSRRGQPTGNPHAIEADFGTPSMVVGAQTVDVPHLIYDGFRFRTGTIRCDGSVEF